MRRRRRYWTSIAKADPLPVLRFDQFAWYRVRVLIHPIPSGLRIRRTRAWARSRPMSAAWMEFVKMAVSIRVVEQQGAPE